MRYEIGPIRPPSEAHSLLVRFTRNCPWGKCAFCRTFKGKRFEKRSLEEIRKDIDVIRTIRDDIVALSRERGFGGAINDNLINLIFSSPVHNEYVRSVAAWLYFGGKNVFIQDANSLAMKPVDFIDALAYLKEGFPSIERVTSYARSRTIAKRLTADDLAKMRKTGLTRLHIGFETGSDFLLKYIEKGVTKEEQIECGRKVKESGIELSEYVILGLGGTKWREEHAAETADALNRINPDFIRFRTLKVFPNTPLQQKVEAGDFIIPHEDETLLEERSLIEKLEGITSYIQSDHMLNLLEEVEGRLPEEKERILSVIDGYLSLNGEQRLIYRFGRRTGIYRSTKDLRDEVTYSRVRKAVREIEEEGPGTVDKALSRLLENDL